jgi:hypothetical protein
MMDSTFEWPKAMEVSRLENNNLRDSAVLKMVMEEASAKEEHGLDSRLAPPNEEVGTWREFRHGRNGEGRKDSRQLTELALCQVKKRPVPII